MNAPIEASRRAFMLGMSAIGVGTAAAHRSTDTAATRITPIKAPTADEGVTVRWLEEAPKTTTGSSWGVPWARGTVRKGMEFALSTKSGRTVPVQTWPLAYWPDGSIKWTGHAVGTDAGRETTLHLKKGKPAAAQHSVSVRRHGDRIIMANGVVKVVLNTSGRTLIEKVERGGRVTGSDGRLIMTTTNSPDGTRHTHESAGRIEAADVEQHGPVRGVVKLTGHYSPRRGKHAIPWSVRVYLGADGESFRIVHSFTWRGDPEKTFISGLGLRLDVPMDDPTHNRHVRFSGADRGVWGEPVRVLTGLRREPGEKVDAAQVAGKATPPVSDWAEEVRDGYRDLAEWNDFSLIQSSADSFTVRKRTSEKYRWLADAGYGDRASGFAYVGGVSGGLGVGIRNFWQQFPRALDIGNAAGDVATVTLWSWSPHAAPMDMRPYDGAGHGLALAYEDGRYGFGRPDGVSRSTDMEIWAFEATPERNRIADLAATLSAPPQLVTTPQTYHAAGVFGQWSLPDRSTKALRTLESGVDATIDFYISQVEQRHWYGFWNFGDVMHTYDADRHSWRYDVGGYAWDNAELGSDAMLWYSFLRTGQAKTFRLAHAMTRHVSESDTYHAGDFVGLGSRHNVLHWGCGAKEARVSESFTKRFMYYTTADELVGDWMRTSLKVDETLLKFDPLRDILDDQHRAPTRLRIGPDWYALVSNWLTEWERTGDTKWRDRITTGMKDIASFPAGLFTGEAGGVVGFDPKTAHLTNFHKGDYKGGYNLAMAFCGDLILFEAIDLVKQKDFRDKVLEFARYVQAPSKEKIKHFGFDFNPKVFKTIYSRVTAWAGAQLDEPTVRKRGWQEYLDDPAGKPWPAAEHVSGTEVLVPIDEIPAGDIATNDAAQRGLALFELLAIAPHEAP
ncbi:exo-rhamnogalacturonan lyase family protein [Spelaeicoccus albus]|uniref:Tat pathway signal sequence domain protein n=1 Tax=Spelaeicoccus albus TaxID=1280376 RepID=A0A7Z0D1R6_9MICO|nr:hypothetical protein [Spelaeicoccus albus]NYI66717.1 hypothetical protein [Spelaeicoccus albus]